MKFTAVVLVMLVNASVLASEDVKLNGELIEGNEITMPYVKSLEVHVKGSKKVTVFNPSTYMLRNGVYKMNGGGCYVVQAKLLELKRVAAGEGYIEVPYIEESVTKVDCPSIANNKTRL